MNGNDNNQRAAAKSVNKAAKASQVTAGVNLEKKPKKKPKKVQKPKTLESETKRELIRRGCPEGDLKTWFYAMGKPFSIQGVLCPVGFNPVPSFFKTPARTSFLRQQLVVPAGRSTTFYLFGGHAASPEQIPSTPAAYNMDGTSYHAVTQRVGDPGVNFSVGPVQVGAGLLPIGGIWQEDHVTGDLINNTAISSAKPITYDKQLPYVLTAANGSHGRWQQVSCGIKAINVTPMISRGGSVITALPIPANYGPSNVADLVQFPSFHDHGPSMSAKGEGVCWFPKPTDVAFWHTSAVGGSAVLGTNMYGCGLICTISAPAGNAQTFDIEIAWNWQLAGSYFQTVATNHPTRNENLPVASTTVQLMGATAKSGSSGSEILDHVVSHPALKAAGSGLVDAVIAGVKKSAFGL